MVASDGQSILQAALQPAVTARAAAALHTMARRVYEREYYSKAALLCSISMSKEWGPLPGIVWYIYI